MIYTAIGGSVSKPLETRVPAIFQALMFYLRHISSLYDLRKANEPFLVQGNTEQDWGFGQVAAVALLGNNVTMVLVAIWSMCTVQYSNCELTTGYRISSVAETTGSSSGPSTTT